MFRKWVTRAFGAGIVSLCLVANAQLRAADEVLTIGSEAPAIDIEHWVQNGNGKFKPVTKFAKGKVYVIEFWATWCGPCIASMPHLAQLQKDYADKGVQLVSISDEELETVEKFLEREVRNAKPSASETTEGDKAEEADKKPTYKELTSVYCLTADPDRSCHTDYMEAAGQGGIPTAFIVGKDQKIEWIGHPMSMDEPLKAIVEDKWDRQKFAEEFKEQQELQLVMAKLQKAMSKQDTAKAIEIVDEAIAEFKSDATKDNLKLIRLQLQLMDKDSADDLPQIVADAVKQYGDRSEVINGVAWSIVEAMEQGRIEVNQELLGTIRPAIEKAAKEGVGDTRAATLDTAAHVQFLCGDSEAALKTQKEAIELASPQLKKQLKKFLEEVEQAREKKDDAKEEKDK